MILFAISDKGGTGRSVTSCNIAYRNALRQSDTCYLDFDFGSPTAGSVLGLGCTTGVTSSDGLHRYFKGDVQEPRRLDVWEERVRHLPDVLERPAGSGRFDFFPGDRGEGEFTTKLSPERCAQLFVELSGYELVVVDLSAGRSAAAELVLRTLALPEMDGVDYCWLVHHRWTSQHLAAGGGLIEGLRHTAAAVGLDPEEFADQVRTVRTAVLDLDLEAASGRLKELQLVFLRSVDERLKDDAKALGLGQRSLLASIPLDPLLQWREQLISDEDQSREIANQATIDAFDALASKVMDPKTWVTL